MVILFIFTVEPTSIMTYVPISGTVVISLTTKLFVSLLLIELKTLTVETDGIVFSIFKTVLSVTKLLTEELNNDEFSINKLLANEFLMKTNKCSLQIHSKFTIL